MSKRTYKLPNGYTLFVHGKGTERQLRLSVSNEKEPIPVYEEVVFEPLLEMVDRISKELEEVHEYRKSMVRLMSEVTDILSVSMLPTTKNELALERIYRWLHENKPVGQEGEGNQ